MPSAGRRGPLLALLLGVLVVTCVTGGALVLVVGRDTARVTEGAGTDAAPGDADPAEMRGEAAPFVLAGRTFPAGSRREGRRRVVTPDGEVWVRGRGSRDWVLLRAEADDPAPPARPPVRPPVVRPGEPGGGTADRGGPPAEGVRAVIEKNLRPSAQALADGSAGPQEPIAEGWREADATLVPSGEMPSIGAARSDAREPDALDVTGAEEQVAVVGRQGLRGDYYDFLDGELYEIPDLETLPPTFSRIDLALDFVSDEAFALPFPPETFATLWRGYVHAPEGGEYRFTIGSDDGVRLEIDDEVVLEHTGLRAYGETARPVTLGAGPHSIRVTFYENRVFASCRLFWQGPTWRKRIVPSSALSPPDEVADTIQPHVTRVSPSAALIGDVVVLDGLGFADQAALNRVTFAGVAADVLEASFDELVVRVPLGASTGDVVVQVGPLSSLPRRFTVETATGLFAEYFHVGSDLSKYPDLDTLAPFFVRLDGPLDYHQDNLWEMPYAPDVFAARYTGFLYVPADDEYRITLGCDDGARLSLDGEPYIDVPGLHPYRESSRISAFKRGFHPLELIFFENRGVARLRLFWQRPGDVARTPVPRGFLFPPAELAERPAPTLDPTPLRAAVGETLTLAGTGFGNERGHVRVLFPGEVWARPDDVADDRLTVRVPHGVDSGLLRVQTGVRLSNPIGFGRTSPMGLRADYYVFSSSGELERHATPEALAGLTPNLTRVDTSWQLEKPADWKLPFPAENFAVHWSGTLGLEYPSRFGWLLWADDGAFLHVGGRRIVDCGPFHGLLERGGDSGHGAGAHEVHLYYFQRDGEAKLRLFWNPYGIAEHRPVPARMFTPAPE